jgi:hypothetical protein
MSDKTFTLYSDCNGFLFLILRLPSPLILAPGDTHLTGLLSRDVMGDALWLFSLSPGNFCIVEAEKGDYTYYSRMSPHGIPSISSAVSRIFVGETQKWYSERLLMSDITKPGRRLAMRTNIIAYLSWRCGTGRVHGCCFSLLILFFPMKVPDL